MRKGASVPYIDSQVTDHIAFHDLDAVTIAVDVRLNPRIALLFRVWQLDSLIPQ